MPSFVTPKKNTEFVFYLGLSSLGSINTFQINPTVAVGDVKVTTDGGSLANITNLPVVTPAGSKTLKVILTPAEMNGDNITVIFADVAGDEWSDTIVNIQTSSVQMNEIPSTVWSHIVDGTFTAEEAMRLQDAALFGRLTGAATDTITIRDPDDTKDRIIATVNDDNERTTVVTDKD